MLQGTELVSLGIVDLVVSPNMDTIRQRPGAWGTKKGALNGKYHAE